MREIAATQRLNARAISDRTYHLLVSLRAGENPDAQTLRVIEERFCKELGYAEHQRVSVVHHDTDNVDAASDDDAKGDHARKTKRIHLGSNTKPRRIDWLT